MAVARSSLVDLNVTPYYHITNQCARQSFLTGYDEVTKQDFSHRKTFAINKINHLTKYYAINLVGYAIMCNHYHLILCVDETKAKAFTDDEVIERWCTLYKKGKDQLSQKSSLGETAKAELITSWRSKLMDISWFMRDFGQSIAKMANQEDCCKGHFWAGRFSSKALLDEAAILAAMTYVDLNPLRAKKCKKPEDDPYTSLYARLEYLKSQAKAIGKNQDLRQICDELPQNPDLMPFINTTEQEKEHYDTDMRVNIISSEYYNLLDFSGRQQRPDKKGYIAENTPEIFARLNICVNSWFQMLNRLKRHTGSGAIGLILGNSCFNHKLAA